MIKKSIRKKRGVRTASLCLATAILVAAIPYETQAASVSDLKQQISELESQQAQIQKEQKELKEDLNEQEALKASYEKEIAIVEEQLENYSNQIKQVNADIEETDVRITTTNQNITQKEQEISTKELEIEDTNEAFKERLDAMYMSDSTNSTLAILFGAESFSDFLSGMEIVKSISKHDQDMLDLLDKQHKELEQLKEELEGEKAVLEDEKEKQETLKAELEGVQVQFEAKGQELEKLYSDTQDTIVTISERQGELEIQKEANYANIRESESEIARIEELARKADEEQRRRQEEAKKNENSSSNSSNNNNSNSTGSGSGSGSGNSSGSNSSGRTPNSQGYIWPLDSTRITCHWMGYAGHRGLDIGASTGSNIYVVRDGVVVDVQKWDGSTTTGMQAYGNMVRVYHPDTGTYTRYAHCNATKVSVGQYVSQGEVIAYVGSTGNSTGAHLHIELSTGSSNSTRVDPYPYIKTSSMS